VENGQGASEAGKTWFCLKAPSRRKQSAAAQGNALFTNRWELGLPGNAELAFE